MTKMIIKTLITITAFMLVGITPVIAAQVNCNMTGSMTITGANSRPDVSNLAVSQNSYVGYNTDSATSMGVTSTSGKATATEVLQFCVLSNQTSGATDDNNVYQRAPGVEQTEALAVTFAPSGTGDNPWFIRGTGSVSTY